MPAYAREQSGVDEPLTLRTALEDDLSIIGLDMHELLEGFGERYGVDLTRFDFTGLISPESGCNPLVALLLALYGALWVLGWVANVVAALCWLPFSWAKARLMLRAGIGEPATVARALLFPAWQPQTSAQVLTVGDLVASAAVGYFVKRERVRLVLAQPG